MSNPTRSPGDNSPLPTVRFEPSQCRFKGEADEPISTTEWFCMSGLLVFAAVGLVGTGIGLVNASESLILAFTFALSCAALGFAILWLRRLWKPKLRIAQRFSAVFPHLPHEVGMAFVVGAVVFLCVEVTLRLAEARATTKTFGEFSKELKKEVEEHLTDFEHKIKLKDEKLQELTEAKDRLTQVKVDLGSFVDGTALSERISRDPIPNDRIMAQLRADIPRWTKANKAYETLNADSGLTARTLDLWASRYLDSYGQMRWLIGDYKDAQASFAKAFEIDKRRLDGDPDDDERQQYLRISYRKLVGISFCQMNTKKSADYRRACEYQAQLLAWLKGVVGAATELGKESPDSATKRRIEKLNDAFDQETRILQELEVTEDLSPGKNIPGELVDSDLAFFRGTHRTKDYTPKCKVFALRLEGDKTYQFRLATTGKNPFDGCLLLQSGFLDSIAFKDDNGSEKPEAFTQRIRNTGTYQLFVASSPIPIFPKNSPVTSTGKFTLSITALD